MFGQYTVVNLIITTVVVQVTLQVHNMIEVFFLFNASIHIFLYNVSQFFEID